MLRLMITMVLALAVAGPALAGDLGQVRVPMPDGARDDAARQAALTTGLEQVIMRLTGKSAAQVGDLPGVQQALETPDKWLLRYGYESGEPPYLHARFNADALAGYLARQGVAVWSGPRPSILVWLVDEGNRQGRMVHAGGALAAVVNEAAGQRGLEVILPKWDDQDREALTVADIRGHFDGPMLAASRRYGTDWIATAVIYGGTQPVINWRLLHAGKTVADQRVRVASKGAAITAMVNGISDALVDRFRVAGNGGADQSDQVVVRGVTTLRRWVDLKQHLLDLGAVGQVHLRRVDGDTLTLSVGFAGSRSELGQVLTRLPGFRACGGSLPARDAASAGHSSAAVSAPPPLVFCAR